MHPLLSAEGSWGVLGRVTKNHYIGGDCLKRGACTVCRFTGGLEKKEGGGGVLGGWVIPQYTLWQCHRQYDYNQSNLCFTLSIYLLIITDMFLNFIVDIS